MIRQQTSSPAPGGNPKNAGLLISSHLINDMYPNLYPALLPAVLMVDLKFSIAAAGLISTISSLSTQFGQPFLGIWADRLGGRTFVVGGLTLASLIVPLTLGWAPSYFLLLLGLLIGGLGNAAFHPHALSIMSELTGKRKGFGMSFFMVGGNLGRALAPLIASTAVIAAGRQGLIVLAVPGLVMAFILALKINLPQTQKLPREEIVFGNLLFGLKKARILLTIVGLRYMTIMSTATLVPILWDSQGYSLNLYANVLVVIFIAGMFGNLIGGALSDSFGHKAVIIGSALLSSLWLLVFLNINNIMIGFIVIALFGASLYSADPVTMVVSHLLLPQNKGMASGITVGVGNMLGSLGVALSGLIADIFDPATALYFVAFVVLLCLPLTVILNLGKSSNKVKTSA